MPERGPSTLTRLAAMPLGPLSRSAGEGGPRPARGGVGEG
jgi:hypothetical protein